MITPVASINRFSSYPGPQRTVASPATQPLPLATQAVSFGGDSPSVSEFLAGFFAITLAVVALGLNDSAKKSAAKCNDQFQAAVTAAPAALHSGNPDFISFTQAQIVTAAQDCILSEDSKRAARENGVTLEQVGDKLDGKEGGKLKATIGPTPTGKPGQ